MQRQHADVWVPEKVTCDSAGNCETVRGYWRPGEIYYVDENEAQRNVLIENCMAQRGYRKEHFPPCPKEVRDMVPFEPTVRFPKIGETSCVITDPKTGSWQIVTPVYQ